MEKVTGSSQSIVIFVIYFILIILAIALILRNEKKTPRILWLMVVIIFPYIGSVIYLMKYLLSRRNNLSRY